MPDRIAQITGHWLTIWLWFLIPLAFSFMGWRVSVMTARGIFLVCWLGCIFWSITTHPGESHPWMRGLFIGASGIVLFMIAAWGQPGAIPQSFGTLVARRRLLFSTNKAGKSPKLEIGDSGAVFLWAGQEGKPMVEIFGSSHLTIESIGGRVKVSADIRDKSENLVAEPIRNDWKVSPLAWDRNYTDNALEVRNPQGRIVLQVKALPDKIQLQGEWWDERGDGLRLVKGIDPKTGETGGVMVFMKNGVDQPVPHIEPMFQYPSGLHFGELVHR